MDCLPCLFSSFGEDLKQDGSSSPWLSSHTNEAYGVGIPAELAKTPPRLSRSAQLPE